MIVNGWQKATPSPEKGIGRSEQKANTRAVSNDSEVYPQNMG